MADAHAAMYGWGAGSETDRQSFPLEVGNPDSAAYDASGGTDGLGDYRALNSILPPSPLPRAADFEPGLRAPRYPQMTPSSAPQPLYYGE
jgi:hypothetical protein